MASKVYTHDEQRPCPEYQHNAHKRDFSCKLMEGHKGSPHIDPTTGMRWGHRFPTKRPRKPPQSGDRSMYHRPWYSAKVDKQ